MSKLDKFSDEDLKAELLAREVAREKAKQPVPLAVSDWSAATKLAELIVKDRANPDYFDDGDYEHYAFERLLETVYGPDIWDWWNSFDD